MLQGSRPGRALGAVPVQSSALAEHGEEQFLGFKAQWAPGVLQRRGRLGAAGAGEHQHGQRKQSTADVDPQLMV